MIVGPLARPLGRPMGRTLTLDRGGGAGLTDWVVQSGSGDVSMVGGNLLLATTAQASATFERAWEKALTKGDAILLRVKRDANLSTIDFRLVKGGTTTSLQSVTSLVGMPVGRWFNLVLPIAGFSVNFATLNPVSHVRIIPNPTTGNDTVLEIDSIRWVNGGTQPRVCFEFDDASASTYTTAYPILAANGFVGSIAVDFTNVGNANYMTEGQIEELYDLGWEMLGHHTTQMTSLSDADALAQMTLAQQWLDTRGYTRGRDHWVWPGGFRNEAKDALAATLYRSRRGIAPVVTLSANGYFEPYDVSHRYMGKSTPVTSVKALADRVADRGGTVNLSFHNIVETEVANEDWSIAKFTEAVEYFAALGIVGTSYDEMCP